MKTIYKYELAITDYQEIFMPIGAKILTAQLQHDHIAIWALVHKGGPMEARKFLICGTGNPVAELCGTYIATVQQNQFVWHVFDVKYNETN